MYKTICGTIYQSLIIILRYNINNLKATISFQAPGLLHRPSLPGLRSRSPRSLELFPAARRRISRWSHWRRPSSGTCRGAGRPRRRSRSTRSACTRGLETATRRSSPTRCPCQQISSHYSVVSIFVDTYIHKGLLRKVSAALA